MRLYLLIVIVWFVFVAVLVGFIISSELREEQQQFQHSGDALFQQLSNKTEINESVIEGFASLLASNRQHEWQQLRQYAQRILRRYPHIHTFEIAREVSHENLPEFVADMRRRIAPGFRIARFDFNDRRQWLNVEPRESYFPVVFMEPMQADNRAILGLDLASHQLFRQALQQSKRMDVPVASPPFTLLEGQRGFLLHRAVRQGDAESQPVQFAILAVKAEELVPAELLERDDFTASLYHRDYSNDIKDAELYYKSGRSAGDLERQLFPRLHYERMTMNPGQPFVLAVEKQIGFGDVNTGLIAAVLLVGAISFGAVLVFSRLHHRNEMSRLQYENRLYYLANNDSLTGLANRNFLLDRMRQVLARARRRESRFAVVFMDMNNFKMINDEFGHASGDVLLREIAQRFKDCTREEDTVCRYQGDEFIVLLEEVSHRDETKYIREKLRECLEAPFLIDGHAVYASVSIGIAVFPDDGKSIESLLHVADQNMYREKKNV
ncbi:diguanylate cyclase domain-containing protein [Thiohalophilus sp.]|uniref:diguanylate cyclase domain-containing protein n=1 Tax=Thiohalophilus sp. TaxID=3028392 RepID=UPI002ACDA9E5|nr:diguanylate cyclase [Thiohalophilus sp.]MDZ7661181.1 diguanylate cyclase [Thiohalophilus sp.]